MEILAWAFVWVVLSLPIQLCYRARKTEALPTVHGCYNSTGHIAQGCAIRFMKLHKLSVLQSLFVSGLVISNIIAVKVIVIWKLVVPAAIIIYPFTFLATDIIGELYGKKEADRTVWYGLLASVFAMMIVYAGMLLPAAPFMQKQQAAYELLLGPNRRIVLASLLAYICSQNHDVWAFHFWKRLTKGRYKWLRNNLSTMTSQLIDSVIFIGLAFWGVVPHLGKMILGQYVLKLLIALLDTPLFYALTKERRRHGHT